MEISGIMIKSEEGFFGFVKQHPSVCAEGDSFEEVEKKIDKYWKAYIERVSNMSVKMEMINE